MKNLKVFVPILIVSLFISQFVFQHGLYAKAREIELKLAHMFPVDSPYDKHIKQWAKMVTRKSNGQLKIRIYASNTLLIAPEIYEGVSKGAADLGYAFRYKPTNYSFGVNLPELIPAKDTYMGMKIYEEVWKEFPEIMAKEWSDVKLLWHEASVPTYLFTAETVNKIEDVKGLQIRVPSRILAKMMNDIGAAPAFMTVSDFVIGLDKGTIDGACGIPTMIIDFKIGKKLKSFVMFSFGVSFPSVIMNKRSFKRLSPDLQKILEDTARWGKENGLKTWSDSYDDCVQYCKVSGMDLVYLTPDEKTKWEEHIAGAREAIAKKLDKKGYPGTRVFKFINSRLKYYSKQ